MSRGFHLPDSDNLDVTLAQPDLPGSPLSGKQFPCCVCGTAMEICFTRKKNPKPYTTCFDCGIQTFFRGKAAIQRLTEIVNSGLLIAGKGCRSESAVILFNRLQQLRSQKRKLEEKQGLIICDPDFRNVIRAVDNEMKHVQGELAKLGRKTRRENSKQ
jgi:hypothetical protein